MAHTRHSRPDSGLGFQVEAIETFEVVPSLAEKRRRPLKNFPTVAVDKVSSQNIIFREDLSPKKFTTHTLYYY